MNFNWNVYKIFKNGKRAKAPTHSFIFKGNKEEAYDYFKSSDIATKLSSFKILNASDNQDRITVEDEEEKISKQKNRVLGNLIKEINFESEKRYSAGLVLSKESGWKWQWAILQSATNNYIKGLSPAFDSYEEANSWMDKKITALSTGK